MEYDKPAIIEILTQWLARWQTSTVNVELLDKVITFIKEHPEQHDQGDWMSGALEEPITWDGAYWNCNTTCCVAGWAALFSGVPGRDFEHAVHRPGLPTVSTYAAAQLGLTEEWEDYLFSGAVRDEIFEAADLLTGRIGVSDLCSEGYAWGVAEQVVDDLLDAAWYDEDNLPALAAVASVDLRKPLAEQPDELLAAFGLTREDVTT